MRFWEHVSLYSPPLLLILHTCGVRPSHGWICKRILNQGASSPAVLLFFRDNAPAPHESSGSFVFFLWTLHQPLGPRLPQTSNMVYANILPEAALTVRMRDQMHLKVSAFLKRGRSGPLNGHMAAADVAVWSSVLRGWMNLFLIHLLHKSLFSFKRRGNFTEFSQPIRRKWKCSHCHLTETVSPPKWMCFDFLTLTTGNT